MEILLRKDGNVVDPGGSRTMIPNQDGNVAELGVEGWSIIPREVGNVLDPGLGGWNIIPKKCRDTVAPGVGDWSVILREVGILWRQGWEDGESF